MFMVSVKLKKKRLLIAAAVVMVGVMAVAGAGQALNTDAVVTASDSAAMPERPARVRDNDQRLAYIASFGWEVEPEPVEIMEIVIPSEFDSLYEEYNAMQMELGYDLSRHAGRRGKRFTYVVTNYPGQDQDVRLNLLVRDNRVIGGDVYSTGGEGFMHSLALPG